MMRDQIVLPQSLQETATQGAFSGDTPRIVIPPTLRKDVIRSLHSAHQGISSMNERAKASVYWPGITSDILKARQSCDSCNRTMPSQARTPPVDPCIPTSPFEAIAADYFDYMGSHYFVAADRLSGWVEMQHVKVGTNEAGAQGLCTALRRLMVTFGVPVELSSDGGPEFTADETQAFFKRWGIHHRRSSVSFPSSNGRAELAVKTAKRLIMDNVSADGKLDNDKMVRALLTHRNTPDVGCKLSPAQILLGRPLRDSLPFLHKDVMCFNNPQVHPEWRENWKMKEKTLRERYVKTLEDLKEHARPLPPLRHGDRVFIQNQRGRYPNKWDNSGTVVETKANDQYVVKVAGSGRLTLRNRRFLRRYARHEFHHNSQTTAVVPFPTGNAGAVPDTPCGEHPSSNSYVETPDPEPHQSSAPPTTPTTTECGDSDSSPRQPSPTRLSFGTVPFVPMPESENPTSDNNPTPPVVITPPRRSSRAPKPRMAYDADSGTYKAPTSVPEEV